MSGEVNSVSAPLHAWQCSLYGMSHTGSQILPLAYKCLARAWTRFENLPNTKMLLRMQYKYFITFNTAVIFNHMQHIRYSQSNAAQQLLSIMCSTAVIIHRQSLQIVCSTAVIINRMQHKDMQKSLSSLCTIAVIICVAAHPSLSSTTYIINRVQHSSHYQ